MNVQVQWSKGSDAVSKSFASLALFSALWSLPGCAKDFAGCAETAECEPAVDAGAGGGESSHGAGGMGPNPTEEGDGGADRNCGPNSRSCAGGCVDLNGCCTDDECASGQACTDGVCGSCKISCPAPSRGSGQGVCQGEECTIRCAGGLTLCGDECVALQDDGNRCGACGKACEGGLVCAEGQCGVNCAGGKTACGASCADLATDVNNCGQLVRRVRPLIGNPGDQSQRVGNLD
ncbi:MAG: hypothetical protein RJA70_3478 [Pseudomonadota bacterium]